MKCYFIVGTDTDCGKTYVTANLVKTVPKSMAIKPVASGCFELDNQRISADAMELQKHCNLNLDVINPWRFTRPVSPHIAAKEEGIHLSIAEIANYCLNLSLAHVEQLFIEGAGGLMVPLNDHETWVDFLIATRFPVILVVGMKLGCINHALLTALALKSHNLQSVGWIANCIDPKMLALTENIETLQSMLNIPLLGVVPFAGSLSSICL